MQEETKPRADRQAVEDRKKKRNHLVELGMQAYDELRKISSSEQAAREAGFRLEAFTVMARMGNFNAAIIRDQEAEDVLRFLDDVEEKYDKMEEMLEKLKKERQKEEVEQARWHAAPL
jgi:hypothetical protein